jgi:hypothetical protein
MSLKRDVRDAQLLLERATICFDRHRCAADQISFASQREFGRVTEFAKGTWNLRSGLIFGEKSGSARYSKIAGLQVH